MVTIAIPVYNVEPYVSEALHSAFRQTYKDIEVLVVDDCGSDGSMDIVRDIMPQYPGVKSRIISHEKNLGLGQARNTAIEACESEWLFFLDSDDTMTPTAIERLMAAATNDKSEIIIGSSDTIDDPETIRNIHCLLPRMYLEHEHVGMLLKGKMLPSLNTESWGRLYKTSLLKDNGILTMHPVFEDMMLFMQVGYYAKSISTVPDIVYTYRRRNGSICRSNWRTPERQKSLVDIKLAIEHYKFTHPCEGISEVKDTFVSGIKRLIAK